MEYLLKQFKNTEGKEFDSIYFDGSDTADFLIEWGKIEDHYIDFTIHEIISWTADDDKNSPIDYEKYISGSMKWDGCSHFYFGDKDGYIHLCGKNCFDKHINIMSAIWDICSKKIKSFDHDVAS